MHGGLLNKARRGELAVCLPVGFRRRPDGVVVQDPDEAVRLALTTRFERFATLRNARAVLRYFLAHGLTLPRLVQSGPEAGQIHWLRPSYQMVHRILVNPAYAGAFVYGRCRREVAPGDPPAIVDRRRAPEDWDSVVPDVYPGYLGFDADLANRRQLQDNLYNFDRKGQGAPRDGVALLQGLVVCGRCGHRMGVSYGRGHHRYHCRRNQTSYAEPACQSFLVRDLDRTVAAAFLQAIEPAGIETTLAALQSLDDEHRAIDCQWQLRLERARYEAHLARRQYDAVDPDMRLVARELERRWNAALVEVERLEADYAQVRRTELVPLDETEMQEIRRLAADLPALWHAGTTTPVERKRLLRLVIAAVTVTVDRERRRAVVEILWSGGAKTLHEARCPPLGWHLRTPAAVLERIRTLAGTEPDHRIAEHLNALGLRTQTGKAWTFERVQSMRRQHGIPTACPLGTGPVAPRGDGLMSLKTAANRLGLSQAAVRIWAHRGVVRCDQRRMGSKLWVQMTDADLARLDGSADITGMRTIAEVMTQDGLSRDEVWDLVRQGRYVAYRTARGRNRWDWRLYGPAPNEDRLSA